MKQIIALWILCAAWFAQGAAPIGTNFSRYPNTNVAPASGLLLIAVTNETPKTNYNMLISDFMNQTTNTSVITNWTVAAQPASANLTNWSLIPTGSMANVVSVTYITNAINNISNYINTSGLLSIQTNGVSVTSLMTNLNLLYGTGMVVRTTNVSGDVAIQVSADVTTGFVYQVGTTVSNGVIQEIITASNSVFVSGGAVLWTNSAGIVRLTTNGPVSIANTGLLSGLVVTQDVRFLGHNSASNSVWVCTNGTTGEGEWRTASTTVASVGFATDPTRLILQNTPNAGALYYVGTNGAPVTNDTRSGFEFSMPWLSLRAGVLADGIHPSNLGGQATNYWNNTNIGPVSFAKGSNVYAKAAYSSVGGGAMNLILTNSKYSVIGGGYNNIIDTNSAANTIGGGGFNQLYGRSTAANNVNRTISGGSNNIINGPFTGWSVISGGGDNSIITELSGFATIVAGSANTIQSDGDFAFLGGGSGNTIGDIPAGGGAAGEAQYAFLGGGRQNFGRGQYSVIVGGRANNHNARDNDYSFIGGGGSNTIGTAAGDFESKFAVIVGGRANAIANDATCSIIVGGEVNSIAGVGTNCLIGGGFANSIDANANVATILAGKNNGINANGDFGTVIGNSNQVSAAYAVAIGVSVTNTTTGSVTVGELISYNTPAVIAGAGTGSTNYTLQVTSPEMVLGSSNVNIVAAMGWIDGKTHKWNVSITNLSADTWGFSFSQVSNRVKWQSWMYGTNAPSVLTNNTVLRISGTSTGTNTLAEFKYFSPAL